MSKVLFDSIDEMIGEIQEGDDRSAYLVKYRGKDFFALAVDESAALAEVAKELKMEVGLLPLDLIVAATRRAMAALKANIASGGKPTTNGEAPAVELPKPVAQMKVGEVRALADKLGIDHAGKAREAIEELIFAAKPEWKPAGQTDFPPAEAK